MFGTVAFLKPKAGQEQAFVDLLDKWWKDRAGSGRGEIATTIHRNENVPGELILSVVFESKEAYMANANSPEQNQAYQEMRALLEEDPRWNDGDVLACKHV